MATATGSSYELATSPAPSHSAGDAGSHEALGGSPLDLRLTFDSFVVGRSNTLAHAAAKQVAAGAPRRAGDVQPALHSCRRRSRQDASAAGRSPGPAIPAASARCCISPPRNSCTASSRRCARRLRLAFKEALRGIGVLVIDDLQFLQGKSTQAEFCHTLNALIDAGRRVVIAADRPPVGSRKPR